MRPSTARACGGDEAWAEVNVDALPIAQGAGGVSFAWPTASTVYLYDRQTGLWRSGDAGATWTKVWAMPSLPSFTGWMAADPSDVARLFVSVGEDGLYRLDGAGSGTVDGGQIRSRRIGSFAHPGPVTVSAGGVVLAAELAGQSLADLRMSRNAGDAWHSVADATYRSWALFPLALTTSPDGDVFIATDGDGLLIGHPAQ